MIFATLLIATSVLARNLQQHHKPYGQHQQRPEQHNSNFNMTEILEQLASSGDQDQEINAIIRYAYTEGITYYSTASQQNQQKIKDAFLGMGKVLGEQDQNAQQRFEQNLQYFKGLKEADQDLILTLISNQLKQTLNDSTKQFTSEEVLEEIQSIIEQYKSNQNTNIQSTWNITQFMQQERQNEEMMEELIDRIEELLDQDLKPEEINKNISEFFNKYYNNTEDITMNWEELQQIITNITEMEQQRDTSQEIKDLRQNVRYFVRELLKNGKSEDEIEKEVEDYLKKNGIDHISEDDLQRIRALIHKEIYRYQKQQERDSNDDDTTPQQPIQNENNSNNQEYITYICVFGSIIIIIAIGYVIKRQIIKYKINKGKKQTYNIPESGHDIESMD